VSNTISLERAVFERKLKIKNRKRLLVLWNWMESGFERKPDTGFRFWSYDCGRG